VPSLKLWFNYDAVSLLQLSLLLLILGVGRPSVTQKQSPENRPKVVIDEVQLEGATHLPETIKQQLVVSLKHGEYEEDADWISDLENIVDRAEIESWPDRENEGYLGFSVGAQWKPMRLESRLLHVSVTIEVDEGKQKRLANVQFRYVGAHVIPPAFASTDLRKLIPLKDGEIYDRDEFYGGLSAVARAYSQKGFIDCTETPSLESDDVNQTVAIVIHIHEGPQYRWGNIQVIGLDPRTETLLRAQLKTGNPVNPKLIEDFYRDNKSFLPAGASPESVEWRRDAQHAIVDLAFDFSAPASQSIHD
jgi:outer membrane protein assembly factor BamA